VTKGVVRSVSRSVYLPDPLSWNSTYRIRNLDDHSSARMRFSGLFAGLKGNGRAPTVGRKCWASNAGTSEAA
jgi:hypothetical protein